MQVAINKIKAVQNNLLDEAYLPMVTEKTAKEKEQEAHLLRKQNSQSFNRFLEANCDCV